MEWTQEEKYGHSQAIENHNKDIRIWAKGQFHVTSLTCLERMCHKQSSKKLVKIESMFKRDIPEKKRNNRNNTSNALNNDMIIDVDDDSTSANQLTSQAGPTPKSGSTPKSCEGVPEKYLSDP